MRRLFLLGGSALLLSGSTGITPAFATTGRVAAADNSASLELAIRSADLSPEATTGSDEPQLKPVAPALPIATPPQQPRIKSVSQGQASWYGPGFFGNRTASGEVLRPGTLTAAHRSLPFGTQVRVTNIGNGRSAIVRIKRPRSLPRPPRDRSGPWRRQPAGTHLQRHRQREARKCSNNSLPQSRSTAHWSLAGGLFADQAGPVGAA